MSTLSTFDYAALPPDHLPAVAAAAERIRVRMSRTVQDIIEIGKDLKEVKERIGHGHFLKWIEAEFGMSNATALRFMQVADKFSGKYVTVTNLQPAALYLLAAPSTPDEVVDEALERSKNGQKVGLDDIKELKEKLKKQKEKIEDYKTANMSLNSENKILIKDLNDARDDALTLSEKVERLSEEIKRLREENVITIDNDGVIIDEYGPLKDYFEAMWSSLPEAVRHWARMTVVNRS